MVKSKLAFSSMILGFITIFLVFILIFLNDFIDTYLTYRVGDIYFQIGGFILLALVLISWLLTGIFGFRSYYLIKKNKNLEGINYLIIGLGIFLLSIIIYLLLIILKI